MTALRRNPGMIEAIGPSLSIIVPTMAMAINVTLAAGAAGTEAPLAFAIGTVAVAIVGFLFVAFSRRVAHAGSAYAYISTEFGPKVGFVSDWALMLTYLYYGSTTAAFFGDFIDAALADYHLTVPGLWIAAAILATGVAILLAYWDMRLAARLMLPLETVSVLAIILLGLTVLRGVQAKGGLSTGSLMLDPHFGWSGIGYATVFAVLSFAGFEGAATLGEQTANLRRAIPVAVLGTPTLDNHSAHISKETKAWIASQPEGRFTFEFTPKHGSWLDLVEGLFSKMARSLLRRIRATSKEELKARILAYLDDLSRQPVIPTWTYKIDAAP